MTIAEQIACAERELRLRQRCYPKWVQERRMSQATADKEIAGMTAIIETLRELQKQSELFS